MVKPESLKLVSPGMEKEGKGEGKPEKGKQGNNEVQKKQEDFKNKKARLEEKKSRIKEKTDAPNVFETDASGGVMPPTFDPVKKVETDVLKKEKQEDIKEVIKALALKHDAEVASVKEIGSLDSLDIDTKIVVHTEIIRRSLDPEKIPQEFRDIAQKEFLPGGVGPTTPEQDQLIKMLALQKQAQKIQKDYEKALSDDEKTSSGKTAETMLKGLDPVLQDALTLKVLKKGVDGKENSAKIGEETGMEIVERVLAERNLKEFIDSVGPEGFDIREVPINIKRQIFLNENFGVPENIHGTIDGIKLALGNGELPIDRSDYLAGLEGDKKYQEDMSKMMEGYTGLKEEDMTNVMQKLQSNPNVQSGNLKNIHPFLRFLLDILSGIGVALEEAGLIKGDSWRRYVGNRNSQGGNVEYTQNGKSTASFEVGKTISGEELITSAEKYLGKPYRMGGTGRLDVPGDPIDCSQFVVNSLRDLGCVPSGFDTTASGFAARSELAEQMSGKSGDFLIRTEGGSDHIAIITGGPDAQGNYQTIESTSSNPAGSGVIKTSRQASPDGVSTGFKVHKNPFLHGNKPEWNTDENIPEGGDSKNIVPTHYWHEKAYDSKVDDWTKKGATKSGVSLFDKSGNAITPETHGYGFCAVDSDLIPFGSLVVANGKKYYAVDIGTDVTNKVAAKARGLSGTPVIDFYSKNPVGMEGNGQSMNVRIIPPNKSDRSLAALKKGYFPRDIAEVDPSLTGNAKKILDVALQACSRGDIMGAAHCTDWVDKVFKKTTGSSVYNARTYFNGVRSISGGTGIGGQEAPREQLQKIVAGQHLILDKPGGNGSYGVGKTHSVIALGSPQNGLIKVVSYPNNKIPPKIEIYDLWAQGRGQKNGKVLRIQGA